MKNEVVYHGNNYFCSNYDGSWWRRSKWDNPNCFIGAGHNLPKAVRQVVRKQLAPIFWLDFANLM